MERGYGGSLSSTKPLSEVIKHPTVKAEGESTPPSPATEEKSQ